MPAMAPVNCATAFGSPSTIAASAGNKVLVELCHPTPVYVA
jgi:hypothetical protein